MRLSLGSSITDDPTPRGFAPGSLAWRVTLHLRHEDIHRTITVPFYTGPLAGEPTARDVAECLARDAEAGAMEFPDFAEEMDYDNPRDAYTTWQACQAHAAKWEAFTADLPADVLDDLARAIDGDGPDDLDGDGPDDLYSDEPEDDEPEDDEPEDDEPEPTYSIVRHFAPHLDRSSEVVRTGLTLDEAREHCSDPSTRSEGEWFDGYSEE
jgi:hypothetical protein